MSAGMNRVLLLVPGSRWLSKIDEFGEFSAGDGKFLYWNGFVDKATAALRAALGILMIAAVVDYVPDHDLKVYCASFTTFAPMIAANAGESSLGKVLQNIVAVFETSVITMCVTMLVLRFIVPPFHLGVTVICIGVSSFAIAYPTRISVLGKKVGLAQIVITFVSAHLNPDLDVVHMPVKYLSSITVGSAAALVAYSFPAPRLGVVQVPHTDRPPPSHNQLSQLKEHICLPSIAKYTNSFGKFLLSFVRSPCSARAAFGRGRPDYVSESE